MRSVMPADGQWHRINFTPWAMHAQYYGGLAQGIYKAEGIDLEIRPPSAGQQNEVFIGMGPSKFADGKLTDESTRKFLTDLLIAFKPWIERMRVKK